MVSYGSQIYISFTEEQNIVINEYFIYKKYVIMNHIRRLNVKI